jgi:hypothetical protein
VYTKLLYTALYAAIILAIWPSMTVSQTVILGRGPSMTATYSVHNTYLNCLTSAFSLQKWYFCNYGLCRFLINFIWRSSPQLLPWRQNIIWFTAISFCIEFWLLRSRLCEYFRTDTAVTSSYVAWIRGLVTTRLRVWIAPRTIAPTPTLGRSALPWLHRFPVSLNW